MKTMLRVTLALALAVTAACDATQPDVPRPGDLTLELFSTQTDGGLTIAINAPQNVTIERVEAVSPDHTVFHRGIDGNRRVAIIGTIAAGPLLRIAVSDARKPESFSVRIEQIATTTNALRESVAGYTTNLR